MVRCPKAFGHVLYIIKIYCTCLHSHPTCYVTPRVNTRGHLVTREKSPMSYLEFECEFENEFV